MTGAPFAARSIVRPKSFSFSYSYSFSSDVLRSGENEPELVYKNATDPDLPQLA